MTLTRFVPLLLACLALYQWHTHSSRERARVRQVGLSRKAPEVTTWEGEGGR